MICVSVNDANPPLPVVQRFVHLLDFSDMDYAEEIGEEEKNCLKNLNMNALRCIFGNMVILKSCTVYFISGPFAIEFETG